MTKDAPVDPHREDPIQAAVVGAGSWGTALALLLHENGHRVRLWTHDEIVVDEVERLGENRTYLPGVSVPDGIQVFSRIDQVVNQAELVVSVSPSQFVGSVMKTALPHLRSDALVVSASKGIEIESLQTMHGVLSPLLPEGMGNTICVLSGPSFAAEVARKEPTAVVVASESRDARHQAQALFTSDTFRVYTDPDVLGVELGGAVKNVIALAAGVAAGLEFGHNTRAALITRGLAEMTRLGVAMGASQATFSGLAGMGDLVLTCTGELSRNRTVGTRLARGESLEEILSTTKSVAEGVRTAPAVHRLAREHNVEMPITQQVCRMLQGEVQPRNAVRELMTRDPKPERWS